MDPALRALTKPLPQQANSKRQTLFKMSGTTGNIRSDINQLVEDRQRHKRIEPDDAEAVFTAITLIADRISNDLSGDGN